MRTFKDKFVMCKFYASSFRTPFSFLEKRDLSRLRRLRLRLKQMLIETIANGGIDSSQRGID